MRIPSTTRLRWYLGVPALLLSACGVEPLDPGDGPLADPGQETIEEAPIPTPVQGPPRQGMEMQCPWLLGEELDALPGSTGRHLSVLATARTLSGAPRNVRIVGGAGLHVVGSNAVADDLVFDGVAGGQLKIDISRSFPGLTYYRLWHRAVSGGPWVEQCGGDEALALHGSFTTTGLHEPTTGQISFACKISGAFKCTDWGYRAGTNPDVEMWDIHQACTRMTRADYCADGTSHTEEGTRLVIFDEVGVNPEPPMAFYGVDSWPPPPYRFYFEAGWRPDDEPPVCLSKLRWSNMPIGGLCPTVLPDPRVDASAEFCDDMATSAEQLSVLFDTKLFNASLYNTLPTHVWRDGSDFVSTLDGYYTDPAVTPPLAPYRNLGNFQWVAADATLLRSLPQGISTTDVIDVDLYSDGTDRVYLPVTATALVPPTFRSMGWRGMAYDAAREGTAPLVLYRHDTTGDHITTSLALPDHYTSLGVVGHVSVIAAP